MVGHHTPPPRNLIAHPAAFVDYPARWARLGGPASARLACAIWARRAAEV